MRENGFACVIWSENMAVTGETAARSVNLAQATQSRLGEANKDSPWPDRTNSRPGDSLNFWASEPLAQARGISLKRDPAVVPVFLRFKSRLSGGRLAWARLARLSETLQPERGVWAKQCGVGLRFCPLVLGFVWVWLLG